MNYPYNPYNSYPYSNNRYDNYHRPNFNPPYNQVPNYVTPQYDPSAFKFDPITGQPLYNNQQSNVNHQQPNNNQVQQQPVQNNNNNLPFDPNILMNMLDSFAKTDDGKQLSAMLNKFSRFVQSQTAKPNDQSQNTNQTSNT